MCIDLSGRTTAKIILKFMRDLSTELNQKLKAERYDTF